ncbi:6187_t:CDS:2, partial [Gigaspora margarita]
KPKIIARGYLLVKNKSRDEKYYWCCKYKNTRSYHRRAITVLEGQEHVLKKFNNHNHAPVAAHVNIVQVLNSLKEKASTTLDYPAQIIQNTVTEMLQNSYSYMSNTNALRKQINYIRKKHLPPQPLSLQAINVSINLCQTINDIEYGEEKIMIFCTIQNLWRLQNASYWIMDGTFKTIPNLFQQLYTIHALVGKGKNALIFPLVYVLIINKLEEGYLHLFQELIELGKGSGYSLDLPIVLSNFELATINAVQNKFPILLIKVDFSSLPKFLEKIQLLTALAFLPSTEIPSAFDYIKITLPSSEKYYYVHSKVLQQIRNRANFRSVPTYSPAL